MLSSALTGIIRSNLLTSTLLLIGIFSLAFTANAETNFPGGVAELKLSKISSDLPEVRFGLHEPVIIEKTSHWRILIGLDLDTLPGNYLVYVKQNTEGSSGEHKQLTVEQTHYPLLEFDKQDAVLMRDHKSMSDIDFNNTQQPSLPLLLPAKGKWTDTFGHRSFDSKNNKLIAQNAVSLTTTELAMAVAPQNAIVSKIEINDTGIATMFLDHGRGLYSVLEGLKDLTVESGNGVVAGAVLGRLANTKPNSEIKRLVWQTQLNGSYVNPLILTQLKP